MNSAKLFQVSVGCLVSLLSGPALVGCAEDGGSRETVTAQQDGIVIASADSLSGLTGTYTKQGRTIQFAALRGERNHEELLADPDMPEYLIDARFANARGDSFIVSTGGGSLADPSWGTKAEIDDPTERVADLALVAEAVDALSAAEIPNEMNLERSLLIQLAEPLRNTELVTKPDGEMGYACNTGYEHDMYFKIKTVAGIPAHHSAVILYSWYLNSNCTWTSMGYVQSCNHGTCPSDPIMQGWCSWFSPLRTYAWPAFQAYQAYEGGACSTPYSAFSSFGGHNCNDDTYFQGYNIRNNQTWSTSTGPNGICTDQYLHSYAPSCTGARGAP